MHDIVIRGGTIVDGTGAPSFVGDVAIAGDKIVQVGGKAGPGKREVKADGRLVTPGWVDVHTHYDGQATWDPVLAPSSWHGATTIVFGNCGVGFAPVRSEHQVALIEMMEGVEDIPGITLTEGLKWDWESFPEYLDALARLHWPVFDNFHFDGLSLSEEAVMVDWVSRNGVDKQRFVDTYRSPAVDAKIAAAREMVKAYEVKGVPTVVVDGKFRTSAGMAGGTAQLLPLVERLIGVARRERAK